MGRRASGAAAMLKSASRVSVSGGKDVANGPHGDDDKLMIEKFKAIEANERVDSLAQQSSKNISTQGSWTNREEQWYFVNKRLLFAT